MNRREPERDARLRIRHRRQPPQFLAKHQRHDGGRNDAGSGRAPAEMGEHVGGVPIPFGGDHQNRRRRKMGECAANRNVHKQQPDGRVRQRPADGLVEIPPFEHQCQQRHGGRFRDEGSQQGSERQRRQIKRETLPSGQHFGQQRNQPLGQPHHRSCGRHDHDDKNEFRFVEVEAVKVLHRRSHRATGHGNRQKQRRRPQAKDHLRFRQKMQQMRQHRPGRRAMRRVRKLFHTKRVQHRGAKQHRSQNFNRA